MKNRKIKKLQRKIKRFQRKVKNLLIKGWRKVTAPPRILWFMFKMYDLHYLQIWHFWPKSNFKEVSEGYSRKLRTLRSY